MPKLENSCMVLLGLALTAVGGLAQAPQVAAAAPSSDGITVDMMPITQDQIKSCRDQATGQLADEQNTLHKREHGQDKDKMAQGAVTGATGLATSAVSRRNNWGWWNGGNNNGAQTAAATGETQRTTRNSQDVASTTATSQTVGIDAYQQCILGIKGPEYVHFRQTGQMTAFTPNGPQPAAQTVQAMTPATPPPPAKPTVQDEGDGKHSILNLPGDPEPKEVTQVPGNKNAFIEDATGTKFILMPDGSVTKLPHVKKVAAAAPTSK